MAEPSGPFHLLRAGPGPGRYLCYCRPGPGPGGTVYVTDALEVWAGELGARPPLGCRCQPEEHGTKLREALGRGAASLSLGPGKATLQLREEARCAALDLFKLPITEARSQLQALVFGMAGCVQSLERRLEGGCQSCAHVLSRTLQVPSAVAAVSCPAVLVPLPAQKGSGLSMVPLRVSGAHCAQVRCRASPDPSPRKNRGAGLAFPAKRKIPGESLINPGFKSKKAPSGVDFEDS
ncbi:protein PAXX isoform X3 [Balearica regulorum gibbericeps]|uniref:protein PAXX isoform X3 n=1 Tax=Balearica regulorum gibbericeps TaxID=100784 RepID=UPI003F61CE79